MTDPNTIPVDTWTPPIPEALIQTDDNGDPAEPQMDEAETDAAILATGLV